MSVNNSALIVVGSGARMFREYILQTLSTAYSLILLDSTAPTWQRPYLDDFRLAPLNDADRTAAIARGVAAEHAPRGVLSYDERVVETAAAVATALGLPGHPRRAVAGCRDKLLTRRALAGTPGQVRSVPVGSIREAHEAAASLGYPVVLKPRALAGSFGVVRADGAEELEERFDAVRCTVFPGLDARGLLVEEYLEGPEISAECAVHDGRVDLLAVARKEVGLAPFFEELGHVVWADDPLRTDAALGEHVAEVHRRLGLATGVTHAEFRLTGKGIRLVEVNARLAGDMIPLLVRLAIGTDVPRVAAAIACGQPPSPSTEAGSGCAAVRFIYPPEDAVVKRVHEPPDMEPWLRLARWEVDPGADVKLPPAAFMSRLGHVVVVGDTPRECRSRLDVADQALRGLIEFAPREHPASAR